MDKEFRRILMQVGGAILALVVVITFFTVLRVVKIEGDEAAVRQDWHKGVLNDIWGPGTQWYNGWTTDVYKYDIGTQKVTFDDSSSNHGAEFPRILVNVGENGGQAAWIAMSVNYRMGWDDTSAGPVFSPDKLIRIHKDGIGKTYEDVVVKRTIVDVVNKVARPYGALDIYSGKGFNEFKERLEKELKNHPVFKQRGIYVENTIVYKVYLDEAYEREIAGKQLAIQQTLRKVEETKAAQEEAKRAFAVAQATVEVARQTAEAAKITKITNAEADKQQAVLAAEGDKQKKILDAEGQRDANLAQASGILAVGESNAKVAQLNRDAMYSGESGERRARVEIAQAQAEKAKGILQGVQIIPEKTIMSLGGKALGLNIEGEDK